MGLSSKVGQMRRVLIVDGDEGFRHALQSDFQSHGFEVETAQNDVQATDKLGRAPFDLVVVDPHLGGAGALAVIRQTKRLGHVPQVVLVSGSASMAIVVEALREGVLNLFIKPVGASAVIEALDAWSKPASEHELGASALKVEGVNQFFAISPGLLSIAGFDGYFKLLNPAWAKLLGYSIDELCATPYRDHMHPDDREKAKDESVETGADGRTVFFFKNRFRCRDGSYRWLSWSAAPSGKTGLIYGVARDVTKTVRMEEGLRTANEGLRRTVKSSEDDLVASSLRHDSLLELGKMKDDLALMVVHDLKGPLSVILTNYDYVVEGFEGPPECLEALTDSQVAGRRMLRLLTNLLVTTRLEIGTFPVKPSAFTLAPMLNAIADQRRVSARLKEISITVIAPPDLSLTADLDLVTRAVENLVDNALQHTPSGGAVTLEAGLVGTHLEVKIANTGSPIPMAARETIFTKFAQTRGTSSRLNLGLGLYFCRLALEAHGGSIRVEDGAGPTTVFALQLPRPVANERREPLTSIRR